MIYWFNVHRTATTCMFDRWTDACAFFQRPIRPFQPAAADDGLGQTGRGAQDEDRRLAGVVSTPEEQIWPTQFAVICQRVWRPYIKKLVLWSSFSRNVLDPPSIRPSSFRLIFSLYVSTRQAFFQRPIRYLFSFTRYRSINCPNRICQTKVTMFPVPA